jgi:tRNA uridine 5-carbamoylmethylation protein Kti12
MDTIKQLTELDYSTLVIGVAIVAGVFKVICEFCVWIIQFFGLETKGMRQKREEHELLIKTADNLDSLQKKQEEDVKQSIRHDKVIKDDLKIVSNKVDAIAVTLNKMQQADNITEMKKLKGKLVSYYNKYKNSDGWTSMDKEVFWDLFEDYELRGGDGFVHGTIEPVMRELKVIDKE